MKKETKISYTTIATINKYPYSVFCGEEANDIYTQDNYPDDETLWGDYNQDEPLTQDGIDKEEKEWQSYLLEIANRADDEE